MAARQIPQYTDTQLQRELARTAKATWNREESGLEREDFDAGWNYRVDLLSERDRRNAIRAQAVA